MRTLSFVVPGLPIAQPRPQPAAAMMGGKMRGVMRDAPKEHPAHAWRARVSLAAVVALSAETSAQALTGPLRATLVFHLPRPKSHWGTGKNEGVLKPNAPEWHTGKPDAENLSKAVCDALECIAFANDSQIATLKVFKRWANECPECHIKLEELGRTGSEEAP